MSHDQPSGPARDAATSPGRQEFRSLYSDEAPRLSRFFRTRLGAVDDVADLVQEAFVRFLGATPAVDRPAAYLHRIAQNLLRDRARAGRRRGIGGLPLPIDDVEIAVAPDQTHRIEADDLMDRYRLALAALPPRTREVFSLHRADGLSYRAVADRLGIGVRTVEWHMAEALVRIRRTLDEQ